MIDISDKLQRHTSSKYKVRLATAIKQIVIHHSATKPNSCERHKLTQRRLPGIT